MNEQYVINNSYVLRAVHMLLTIPKFVGLEEKKTEYRNFGQTCVHTFAKLLAIAAQDNESGDVKREAINSIKQVSTIYFLDSYFDKSLYRVQKITKLLLLNIFRNILSH